MLNPTISRLRRGRLDFLLGTTVRCRSACHDHLPELHRRVFSRNRCPPDDRGKEPGQGQVFASVTAATEADVIEAVDAAALAQKPWARLPAIERGNALRRLADAVERYQQKIGAALAQESGKSLDDAVAETGYGVELMRYHAEWARRVEGEVIESDTPDETLMLKRAPIGVVACLIPFNFPIYTLVRKIAPALITGNAVVVRPSNNTPTSAFVFAEAIKEADLPQASSASWP